ncbi:Isopentenyldiphosphate isomerase [Ascobolus immersus RN42]|uniref:isopentenyl-diphosphate Delta-isomerase n=1 Tax=Ascobolus immersus RN42 TaxID=1160509 RepID=A0A3N4ITL0_ASCIM|nr:Isopentenyldiphosphate isomerase [Ascobolus immersus RN42]
MATTVTDTGRTTEVANTNESGSTVTVEATFQPHHNIVEADIVREFPEIVSNQNGIDSSDLQSAGYDPEQIRLMEEVCIVLDSNDKPIGTGSKKLCHLMTNINKGLLHRAFSVFLFDQEGRLLLQQRADEKITFPGMWTNTCCSHPLGVPGETGSELQESILGVKRAAQRKLDQELGIKSEQVPLDKFKFLTRIHYLAPSDGKWGEHEIDYILFIQTPVDTVPNPNEVKDVKYVTQQELKDMFKTDGLTFTPWFKLICESLLFKWWDNLSNIHSVAEDQDIIRM